MGAVRACRAAAAERDPPAPGRVTTVLVRHIPVGYTERTLIRMLDAGGFGGGYDFVSVPQRRKGTRKFAFVNFTNPAIARRFAESFAGLRVDPAGARSFLEVEPAKLQGFHRNIECILEHGSPQGAICVLRL